jgi:hypothetical protein
MTGDWLDFGLIADVLDVLELHGYARRDTEHATRAILLISDLARVYDGTVDHPPGPDLHQAAPSRPASHDAAALPAGQVTTILAALDEAAEYKRDRAATCADCADRSCGTCQGRLQAAREYDQVAARLHQAAEAAAAAAQRPVPDRVRPVRGQPQAAADPEAGQ